MDLGKVLFWNDQAKPSYIRDRSDMRQFYFYNSQIFKMIEKLKLE